MRRLAVVLALIVPGLGLLPAHAERPDPHVQSIQDGCQRYGIGIVALTAPEWVYVNKVDVAAKKALGDPSAGIRTVEGLVNDVHPAGDDEFYNHDFNDIDVGVAPDPAFGDAVEIGGTDIGLEWEEAQVPGWVIPQIGDRVRATGSHIWDCGHWGNGPADPTPGGVGNLFVPYDPIETGQDVISWTKDGKPVIRGEQTEIHPPYELATTRSKAAGLLDTDGDHNPDTPSVLSQLDVWINSDGGWARAEEECTFLGLPPASNHLCSRYRDVSGTYTYTLPLGDPPAGAEEVWNQPLVRAETSGTLGNTPIVVTPDPLGKSLRVSFTIPKGTPDPARFGFTLRAGWTRQTAPVVRHRVTLDAITVRHSLDSPASEPSLNPVANGPEQVKDPAEWVAWANVNGDWMQIPPSKLAGIHEPAAGESETIDLGMTWDVWLPAGVAPRLFVSTRECDIPLVDCTADSFGATPGPVPFAELGYNDHPGRILQPGTHLGVVLSPGTASYAPGYNPNHTANEDLSDYSCRDAQGHGEPCYTVTATLE